MCWLWWSHPETPVLHRLPRLSLTEGLDLTVGAVLAPESFNESNYEGIRNVVSFVCGAGQELHGTETH